jgi:hypothetical protein
LSNWGREDLLWGSEEDLEIQPDAIGFRIRQRSDYIDYNRRKKPIKYSRLNCWPELVPMENCLYLVIITFKTFSIGL